MLKKLRRNGRALRIGRVRSRTVAELPCEVAVGVGNAEFL